MKQTVSMVLGASTLVASFAFALVLPVMATTPTWDTTGDHIVTFEYLGETFDHDLSLIQDEDGYLTGNGGSPAGANTYLWTIEDGRVVDDTIELRADYTATDDAVYPQTTLYVDGIIATDGSMSGTWSDNYNNGIRSGTWTTIADSATYTGHEIENSDTVTVTIEKYVHGVMATAVNAENADFPMTATWYAENTGSGSGSYTLSETNTVPYQALTAEMTKGADYETKELVNGDVVGARCASGKPFALDGYTTGNTKAEALAATRTMAKPSFTNLQSDKHVIVWNRDCSIPGGYIGGNTNGQIGGEVVGNEVALEVTSIEMIKTTAIDNGSFTDGWKYIFHITAPMSENEISMKFSNWLETGGAGVIPVANNMRISSLQADNGGTPITLTAANMYATPDLTMVGDLDLSMDGRQVEITVEVAVPNGTPNGAYTTSYGVRSNP